MEKHPVGKTGQQGFTLIEIIAVLVILGILAVTAVPKYFDLQDKAREQAAKGLVSAAQSQLSLGYANSKLNSDYTFTSSADECAKVAVSGNASITCTGGLPAGPVAITGRVDGIDNTGSWNSPEEQ